MEITKKLTRAWSSTKGFSALFSEDMTPFTSSQALVSSLKNLSSKNLKSVSGIKDSIVKSFRNIGSLKSTV